MIVVADTSPLNYLVLLGHIEVLGDLYGEVLVPHTVMEELQDTNAPAEVRAWVAAPPRWLQISTLHFLRDPLMDRLDRGEQDAILLAESVRAERLIIDDLDGRREVANRGIPVIGTLGILAEAARRNSWICRKRSPRYRAPTSMWPRSLSVCCSLTTPSGVNHFLSHLRRREVKSKRKLSPH